MQKPFPTRKKTNAATLPCSTAIGGGAHGDPFLPVPFVDSLGQPPARRSPFVRPRLRTGFGSVLDRFVGSGAGYGLVGAVL